jgi:hypothetical protein
MLSIVRRDTGETYQEFHTRLVKESGPKTPAREALARLDRRRKKRTSNTDWKNPSDPDAKITKMKDGRTHLAHKAEHAIDLDSGAMVAVTVHGADVGDTTSSSRRRSPPRSTSRPSTRCIARPRRCIVGGEPEARAPRGCMTRRPPA